jgi:predicted amidohydrolase YtcJ
VNRNEQEAEMLKKDTPGGIYFIVAILLLAGWSGCTKKETPADLVLTKGKVVTMDEGLPVAEALAVRGDRIVAVGKSIEMKAFIGDSTRVIDLEGKLAIPGFIDSHAHFSSVGEAKMVLDLTGTKNWPDIVAMVGEAARHAAPGEWVRGRGWHQEKWDQTPEPNIDGLPYHDDLSAVSPDNPVLLTHASGHSCLANAKAMELAGISRATADPPGGEIVRAPGGRPIGAFRETAQGLLEAALARDQAKKTEAERKTAERKAVELAVDECLSKGITSLHDAGTSFATIDLYKALAEEGRLGIRIYAMIGESNAHLAEGLNRYRIEGAGQNHLTVRSIKRLLDGALGAHGAWLLEPYSDLPASTGLNTTPPDEIKETARLAIENGFQLCTHAIGDRANREILDIYEEAFSAHPEKKDLRWRVEHAQHLSPADIPRFGRSGVIASMQGIHCTSDGPWIIKKLGENRARQGAYVWRSLLEGGAVICNGTDAPVEDVDPIPSFYATVTRKMKDGTSFFGEQRLGREEALRTYTINGAYAAFQEDLLGSLRPGKLADITVLTQDILTIPEEEILKTGVALTIVGGKVLFQKS